MLDRLCTAEELDASLRNKSLCSSSPCCSCRTLDESFLEGSTLAIKREEEKDAGEGGEEGEDGGGERVQMAAIRNRTDLVRAMGCEYAHQDEEPKVFERIETWQGKKELVQERLSMDSPSPGSSP